MGVHLTAKVGTEILKEIRGAIMYKSSAFTTGTGSRRLTTYLAETAISTFQPNCSFRQSEEHDSKNHSSPYSACGSEFTLF